MCFFIGFEFWDRESMELVKKVMLTDKDYPIEANTKFYALLETQGSRQEHDQEVIYMFYVFILFKSTNAHKLYYYYH